MRSTQILKLLILIFLALSSNVSARDTHLDNKKICEATKGNWRMFNNDCADNCQSKFDSIICTYDQAYQCDCGGNSCWNGNKCISLKIAQSQWDKIFQKQKELRKVELEEFEKELAKFHEDNPQTVLGPLGSASSNPNQPHNIPPIATLSEKDKQDIVECGKKGGSWKQFQNGCADNCGSTISKFAVCTQRATYGCDCGESKCWDNKNGICANTEQYRNSFFQTNKI
ncbi:MAG: hypothetical protein ACJAW3_000911 [Lentimonas sp.]|jgi:hypothetical protein